MIQLTMVSHQTKRTINKIWATKILSPGLKLYNLITNRHLDCHGHDAYYSEVIIYCPYSSRKSCRVSIFSVCNCSGCQENIYNRSSG